MKPVIKTVGMGLLGLLPIALLVWLYRIAIDIAMIVIEPARKTLPEAWQWHPGWSATLIIFFATLGLLLLGSILRTRLGVWVHKLLEDKILTPYAPGYRFIKEALKPFLAGKGKIPFKHVVIAYPFGTDTTFIVGFITDEHHSQLEAGVFNSETVVTVYNPTAPVPSSGLIYNLPASKVRILEGVRVDDALKPIIACGVGMSSLFAEAEKQVLLTSKN